MENDKYSQCAKCPLPKPQRFCSDPEHGTKPGFCACRLYGEVFQNANEEYKKADIHAFAHDAAAQEAACYHDEPNGTTSPVKPRILEVIEFCQRRGYKKLGLAFCTGLRREAAALAQIFENHGFTIVSVACKCGGVDKSFIDITDEKINHGAGHESMCNPISQAMILNAEQVDFSMLLGLCVGHDSMFIKYINSMCTVVAVKDRLMGHNPLAALYTLDSYYGYLK